MGGIGREQLAKISTDRVLAALSSERIALLDKAAQTNKQTNKQCLLGMFYRIMGILDSESERVSNEVTTVKSHLCCCVSGIDAI